MMKLVIWKIILLILVGTNLNRLSRAIENNQANSFSKNQERGKIRAITHRINGSYFSSWNYRTPRTALRLSGDHVSHNWVNVKSAIYQLGRSLKSLQQNMQTGLATTHEMIEGLQGEVQSLNESRFDQFRQFTMNEENIECLTGNVDRSNMNNSLSMDFTTRNETIDKQIWFLYKTYDSTRLCLSQNLALHWLQKLMMKAGLSNVPVAIFHSQAGVEDPKEEINGAEDLIDGCKNLERLDRNSSVVYVYKNSCVRLYTDLNCRGESFLFTGNDGAAFPFVGSLKYYDKKGRSIGCCVPPISN